MAPIQQSFETQLAAFGMIRKESGLYFVEYKDKEMDPTIRFGLETAQLFGADAVYFRLQADHTKPPKPEIYIYWSSSLIDAESSIHLQIQHVWNAGVVPLCYYFSPTEIKIFNAWNADNSTEFKPTLLQTFDKLKELDATRTKHFHARMIDSGLFWESEARKKFDSTKTAYRKLLEAVSAVKKRITESLPQPQDAPSEDQKTQRRKAIRLVKRLIVMAILIKYLEDRKTTDGVAAIDENYYLSICGLSKLEEIFRNRDACLTLFAKLAEKDSLNGEVFNLSSDEHEVYSTLDGQVFEWIAKFVEGELEWASGKNQPQLKLFRWSLYSFAYLPIELISHIYEDFIGEEGVGVVYTPPQLVQLLLDECLPLHTQTPTRPRVLDPACGSGIFLVGVYKRLIQLWRLHHDWKKPGPKDIPALQDLLHDCIHGCDIGDNGGAVQLTYFSLSLALLDALSPADIIPHVHFRPLIGRNLHGKDFFEVADQLGNFDLIVGNPPYDENLTQGAETAMSALRYQVPRRQIALAFQAQCQTMLRDGGKSCLILPAGPLLYNHGDHNGKEGKKYLIALAFRRQLFAQANFTAILDFTPLRASLFDSNSNRSKPIVAAAIVHNNAESTSWVKHVVFRQCASAELNAAFETDAYDTNWVSREDIDTLPGIWQINFMGGGERLKQLVRRLDRQNNIHAYLKEKSNWREGEGWILNEKLDDIKRANVLSTKENLTTLEIAEFEILKRKYQGPWITGKQYLETELFQDDNIDLKRLRTCEEKFFQWPRHANKEIFLAPHILIKESAKAGERLPVVFLDQDLTFKDKVIGIHAPEDERADLYALFEYLKSDSLGALLWLKSGQIIGMREGVPLKKDIFDLPYPLPEIYPIEQVLLEDIANYQAEFRIKGAKSKVLKPIRRADDPILQDFKTWFLRVSNSDSEEFAEAKTLVGDDFICMAFAWGGPPQIYLAANWPDLEQQLAGLLGHQHSHQLWIQRILRIYTGNVILLVKPNQIRYWTRSIAINDADAVFADMIAQGL